MKQYDPFELVLFGRMIHLRTQIFEMDPVDYDNPYELVLLSTRYLELRDLCQQLGLLDDYIEFMEERPNV